MTETTATSGTATGAIGGTFRIELVRVNGNSAHSLRDKLLESVPPLQELRVPFTVASWCEGLSVTFLELPTREIVGRVIDALAELGCVTFKTTHDYQTQLHFATESRLQRLRDALMGADGTDTDIAFATQEAIRVLEARLREWGEPEREEVVVWSALLP